MSCPAERAGPFSLRVDPSGIVRLTWTPGLQITDVIAGHAMTAVDELNGDQRRPLLVDMTGTAVLTRGARQTFGRPCSASRIALLGKSAVDRVIANFSLRVSPVPVPSRFFTAESAAVAWLGDGNAES